MGLPSLQTPRRRLEPVAADPASPFWQGIEPVSLRDNLGAPAPAQRTRVRTAHDAASWRVLFEVEDARPWATLTAHDAPLWTEEAVEVFIDPVGDLESYFEIEINPLGAVCNLVLRRSASGWTKNFAWNVENLASHARVIPGGWAAELAIPFASLLGQPPEPGARWRVNFLRIDRPHGAGTEADLSAWSPTGVRNFHRPQHFGIVEFAGG